MRPFLIVLVAFAFPLASAGTPDSPEITDPVGDATCVGSAGNEWADIDAAWISDETAEAFNVNIRLASWTSEHLASATGYTVQFTHQRTQFGIAAAYFPAPLGIGWEFSNGYIDLDTQELRDFETATGSFAAGPPAIITVRFDKSHFPHDDPEDNRLVDFKGGSADLKNQVATFMLPLPPQPFEICDRIESSAVYEFQTGDHTMHAMPAADNGTDPASEQSAPATVAPAAAPSSARDTPAPGIALVVVGLALAALRRLR